MLAIHSKLAKTIRINDRPKENVLKPNKAINKIRRLKIKPNLAANIFGALSIIFPLIVKFL